MSIAVVLFILGAVIAVVDGLWGPHPRLLSFAIACIAAGLALTGVVLH